MSDIYELLLDKLDTLGKGFPRTAEGSEMNFIKKVFSEQDAAFHIKMKQGLHSVKETAQYMGISEEEAKENLERMADRHLLFWQYGPNDTEKRYRLVPYVHGIWEFNVDMIDEVDAKNMGYYYVNGFGESLFDYRLPISRVVPIRPEAVKDDQILPVDDVREHIKQQGLIAVTDCACRTVGKFGKPCSCVDTISRCMMFGDTARYYLDEKIGNTRVITTKEALSIIEQDDDLGIFLLAGHSTTYSSVCSCAPCHCGILMAAKVSNRAGPKHKKETFDKWGNYLCTKDTEKCINCGVCIKRCPMRAMRKGDDGIVNFDRSKCFGCGLCVTKCPEKALILDRKPQDQLNLPEDAMAYDAFDRMAIEKAIVDKERLILAAREES